VGGNAFVAATLFADYRGNVASVGLPKVGGCRGRVGAYLAGSIRIVTIAEQTRNETRDSVVSIRSAGAKNESAADHRPTVVEDGCGLP